jgi:hypothetical protein
MALVGLAQFASLDGKSPTTYLLDWPKSLYDVPAPASALEAL